MEPFTVKALPDQGDFLMSFSLRFFYFTSDLARNKNFNFSEKSRTHFSKPILIEILNFGDSTGYFCQQHSLQVEFMPRHLTRASDTSRKCREIFVAAKCHQHQCAKVCKTFQIVGSAL